VSLEAVPPLCLDDVVFEFPEFSFLLTGAFGSAFKDSIISFTRFFEELFALIAGDLPRFLSAFWCW